MHFTLITDLDSELPAEALLQDRGLHYGDGLFETMLMREGQIRYWPEHFARLKESAGRLGIPCPDQHSLAEAINDYRQLAGDRIIKLILTRGSSGRGISWPAEVKPTVYMLHYPKPVLGTEANPTGISATIIPSALSCNPRLARIKHLNRLDYVMASEILSQRSAFNEALLGDQQGNLIEGIVHNLFFVVDDVIHTPSLENAGVNGVMRKVIIKTLKQSGKQVTIGRYQKADILRASELLYCNSVQGVRPVVRIDDNNFEPGPLSEELQRLVNVSQTH